MNKPKIEQIECFNNKIDFINNHKIIKVEGKKNTNKIKNKNSISNSSSLKWTKIGE